MTFVEYQIQTIIQQTTQLEYNCIQYNNFKNQTTVEGQMDYIKNKIKNLFDDTLEILSHSIESNTDVNYLYFLRGYFNSSEDIWLNSTHSYFFHLYNSPINYVIAIKDLERFLAADSDDKLKVTASVQLLKAKYYLFNQYFGTDSKGDYMHPRYEFILSQIDGKDIVPFNPQLDHWSSYVLDIFRSEKRKYCIQDIYDEACTLQINDNPTYFELLKLRTRVLFSITDKILDDPSTDRYLWSCKTNNNLKGLYLSELQRRQIEIGIIDHSILIEQAKGNIAQVHKNRGFLYFLLGNFSSAELDHKKYLELNPKGCSFTYLQELQFRQQGIEQEADAKSLRDQQAYDEFLEGECACGESPCVCSID